MAAILSVGVVAMATSDAGADTDAAQAGSSAPRELDAVRKDAGEALARGDLSRARVLYERVSRLDPTDAHAAREAGRAALALGDLAAGVHALTRADDLAGHAPDPELHYLRGEALAALGQHDPAIRDQRLVERELQGAPPTRQSQLWLARVYARRGELARAELVYRAITPAADQPVDAEVAIHHAESCLLARDGQGAQRVVRALLLRMPDHPRARALLASSLEATGDLEAELALREALARHATTSQPVLDYGRALERSGDYAAALRVYRQARALAGDAGAADPELASALRRMHQRTSIELAAAAQGRSDPQATSLGEQVGIAVPFGSAHHLAIAAWREHLAARDMSRTGDAGELSAAVALHHRRTDVIAGGKLGLRDLRGEDGATDRGVSGTSFAHLRGRPVRALELTLSAEHNALWRETPRSLLEGGHVTGATVHAYGIALASRLIVDAGAQLRRLVLPGQAGAPDPMTSQRLGWVGLDAVLWADYGHALAGEVLDDDMVQPVGLADSVVAGYRHFELRSDSTPEFLQRMSMVGRASIEEASLTARKVLAGNRLGIELRGILGWDRSRDVAISHLGMSLGAAPTRSSRISLALDLGAESPHGFQGQARSGWVSYHADL